jgi:hypothetical protein
MTESIENTQRRTSLRAIALGTLSLTAILSHQSAHAGDQTTAGYSEILPSAHALRNLNSRLSAIPRRRGFKLVPFMLTDPQAWDSEAAAEVLSYRYDVKQMWDNSELDGPWPGLMRESMNGQMFAHGKKDFLAVSATHGLAHLALFSQSMWDKYDLEKLAGPQFPSNTLILEKDGVSPSDSKEDASGFYGPGNNNIVTLQRRGAVFLGCHDSIHAISRLLHESSSFSSNQADNIAADLTNNLIPGVVLVPSVVAFMVDLQRNGFTYV